MTPSVTKKYTLELGWLRDYCERQGVYTVQGITPELLTGFCSGWVILYPSSGTRSKVRERVSGFLNYSFEAQWIPRRPPLPHINVDISPTMTLERAEVPHDAVSGIYRVVTARQKTGTDVSVPLPPSVAQEILSVPNNNPRYLFRTGGGNGETIAKTWASRYIRPLFKVTEIPCDGHMVSHRLRDTFAVDLLVKGAPMEEVSKILGHTSIKTTERHYAKWVPGRQGRADALVMATWDVV